MLPLNARLERFSDGENTWEQYSIPFNSNVHHYLEHSLAQSKLQMQAIVRQVQTAHLEWQLSHIDGRIPTTRIVDIYGKCITVKKHIAKLKTYQTKQREYEKLLKLQETMVPHTTELHSAIERLQKVVDGVQDALKQVNDMLQVPGMAGIIFYRSWSVQSFEQLLQALLEKFNWELEKKKFIETRIVSTMDRNELRMCRSLWQLLHLTEEYAAFHELYGEFRKEIENKDEQQHMQN